MGIQICFTQRGDVGWAGENILLRSLATTRTTLAGQGQKGTWFTISLEGQHLTSSAASARLWETTSWGCRSYQPQPSLQDVSNAWRFAPLKLAVGQIPRSDESMQLQWELWVSGPSLVTQKHQSLPAFIVLNRQAARSASIWVPLFLLLTVKSPLTSAEEMFLKCSDFDKLHCFPLLRQLQYLQAPVFPPSLHTHPHTPSCSRAMLQFQN